MMTDTGPVKYAQPPHLHQIQAGDRPRKGRKHQGRKGQLESLPQKD